MSFRQCVTQHLTRIAFSTSNEWDPTSVVIDFWPIVVGFIYQNKSIMMGSSLIIWTDVGANCGGFLVETVNIGWRRLMWRIFMMQNLGGEDPYSWDLEVLLMKALLSFCLVLLMMEVFQLHLDCNQIIWFVFPKCCMKSRFDFCIGFRN